MPSIHKLVVVATLAFGSIVTARAVPLATVYNPTSAHTYMLVGTPWAESGNTYWLGPKSRVTFAVGCYDVNGGGFDLFIYASPGDVVENPPGLPVFVKSNSTAGENIRAAQYDDGGGSVVTLGSKFTHMYVDGTTGVPAGPHIQIAREQDECK
jgi:hypothetical protein